MSELTLSYWNKVETNLAMKMSRRITCVVIAVFLLFNSHFTACNGDVTEVDIQPDGDIQAPFDGTSRKEPKKMEKSGKLSKEEIAEFKRQTGQTKAKGATDDEDLAAKKKRKKKKKKVANENDGSKPPNIPSRQERAEMRKHATFQEPPDINTPRRRMGKEPYRQPKVDPLEKRFEYGRRGQACYTDASGEYCAPKIFGACCVNSGTTALANYLNSHTNLTFGSTKEHHFFRVQYRPERTIAAHLRDEMPQVNRENLEMPLMDHKEDWRIKSLMNSSVILTPDNYDEVLPEGTMKQASTATISTYMKQFPMGIQNRDTMQAFDFDPTYLWGFTGPSSLELIKEAIGEKNLKMLIVLRNPAHQFCAKMDGRDAYWIKPCLGGLERILTEPDKYDLKWLHDQKDCPPFIFINIEHYCYSHMARRWFEILSQDHFLFVKTEELRGLESRVEALRDIAIWLRVDSSLYDEDVITEEHQSRTKQKLSKSKQYHECYQMFTQESSFMTKCNRELAEMLGDEKWLWWT